MAKGTVSTPDAAREKNTRETITCGLVMPISTIDGCSAEHWIEVKSIILESIVAINDYDISVKLVSEQDDVGVIQKRIVQNIYSSDIVVCDVSCKNPNVMFELGMRLAFDKPTVIIKDDKTDYSFDTGVIEHISYPRDLRFSKVTAFKAALAEKVIATHKAGIAGGETSFLKSFGTFSVSSLEQRVGSPDQVMLEMLQDLSADVARIKRLTYSKERNYASPIRRSIRRAIEKTMSEHPQSVNLDLMGNHSFYDHVLTSVGDVNDQNRSRLYEIVSEELANSLL
ncbi:hypothetical protein QMK47_19510 [Pseudomonas sp. P9_35]|uniref:hypothetical protein n=1 Tax=unclassified Pseudomonas TaxID=196821 RepID=UPI002A370D28|nr:MULTISPECIES: hypothetical protein [unclassified Pseudomonas]WPN61726.1 hypothetical protein QMK48_18610 [Pseudomonas sp. P9_32]WPN67481.1 hypothetical protein QMK47_19510 [Pseudomonas sp. P9_35]